ncbi:MAG: SpoIIE family protein phosphatase [Clostridia bacterium]|nr:SpoIIE family protein phosphatase [Clostridia bacterium]
MDNTTKSGRLRFSISKKLLLSYVLLTFLICAVSTVSGYFQYDNTIRKLYNDNGYVIANIILDHIDHDRVAQYAQTWTEDEHYAEMADYLDSVTEASGAAYIYIVTFSEDHTMRYIYDSSGLKIGDTDPVSSYFDEAWAAYTEGTKPDNYMVRHSKKYGYLTSSMMPVIDSKGNIAAVLLVDVWMEVIMTTLRGYIVNMVLISLFILAIFSIAYWFFTRRNFISPLMRIRHNVKEFAQNETETTISLEPIQTNDEIQDVAESIMLMENDIVKYIDNIQTITAEKERIGAELNVATQIQADMLPRIFPPFPDRNEFDLYATMDPAKEVGGDFYDFFLVDDDHLALVMADVSGKGVPAALFLVIAKTLIKNRAQLGESPAEILKNVNAQLCEGNEAELFVTVWLAVVEISTGRGVAANAGHEHPVIRRADGTYELVVYRHSPAVATMEGLRFREHPFELHPGDSLFVYTDGVPEATNANNELFGADRMLAALNRNPNAAPKELLKTVREEIDAFVGDAPQFDDITMLGVYYAGTEENRVHELTVDAKTENLDQVLAFVDGYLETLNCSAKVQMQIDVAVEELFVNIAHYAYAPETGSVTIRLEAESDPTAVKITLVDQGIPYDPLAKPDPDVTLSAEERQIGGLGIYMVKKSMDDMQYRYENGSNILTIRKAL